MISSRHSVALGILDIGAVDIVSSRTQGYSSCINRADLFSLRIYLTDKVEQDLSFSGGAVGAMSVDNSQDQVKASIQSQRQGFFRVVLAILGVVFCWKISIWMGCKIWGGLALTGVLLMFFPTVFDCRTYNLTKKYSPLVSWTFSVVMVTVTGMIFNLAIALFGIPQ